MVYFDSQLFSVDGVIQTLGASYTIDLSNLMYCVLSKAKDNANADVDTFMCLVDQPNRSGITQVQYRRNSRTMSDFLSDMNAIGGGEPLKLWTNLRSFSGKELFANNLLYDSTVILNDNFQSNCIYSASLDKTSVYIGSQKQISPTVFLVVGNQIGSAPLVDEIVLPVYDGLSAQGTTSSTTTVLRYGVNVFTTVTSTNYAAKLPQPITGKSVKVVNMGTITLALFPSNVGGQINNLPINTPAQIPPDGVLYEFVCIENPLPGAWTWTPPATTQYDSGDITCTTTGGNKVTMAANAANVGERNGFFSSSGWGYDGKNKPLVLVGSDGGGAIIAFKDSTQWAAITKVKVYTNLSAASANVTFGLSGGSQVTYYNPPLDLTADIINNGQGAAGNYGSITSGLYGSCDQIITGASLGVGVLTPNIGDAGTCWGELNIVSGSNGVDSRIGDFFQGLIANPFPPPVQNVDDWFSAYIAFGIQPRQALVGLKFRFFIEHY